MEKLIEKYTETFNNKENLSDNFIEDFIDFYVKELKIEKFVKDIVYQKESGNYYDQENKKVFLNKEILLDYSQIYNYQDKKIEKYFNNSYYCFYILHELIHAKQQKTIEDAKSDLTTYVMTNSYNQFIIDQLRCLKEGLLNKYNDNHDLYLIEYNANIEGYIKILDFIQKIKTDYPINLGPLMTYLKDGYKNILTCPLKQEAKLLGYKYEKFDMSNISEFDKILYGLPIKKQTYQKTRSLYKDGVDDYERYFNNL